MPIRMTDDPDQPDDSGGFEGGAGGEVEAAAAEAFSVYCR